MSELNVKFDGQTLVAGMNGQMLNAASRESLIRGIVGRDGYSPEVTIEEIPGGHEVTITDEEHPEGQSFDVMDGADGRDGVDGQDGAPGADGVSPEVEITSVTGGHAVTITDRDHPQGQSFNVLDGQDGQDGQDGATGPYFTPAVDASGNISWTNNGGLPNPTTMNIKGPTGADGNDGADGQDGVSPEVSISTITGGHSVTITDADHPSGQSFNVMDGADGQTGTMGPPGLAVQATAPTTNVLAWLDTDDDSTVTLAETSDLVPIQNALNNLDAGDVAYDSTETYSSGTVGAMLADVSLHKADVYEIVENIPANSSVSLPFSSLNITTYKSYFITAFGTDNAAWKWAGIFFYSVNGASLDAITTSFLTATISGTNLVITNTHQEYGMNIAIKII